MYMLLDILCAEHENTFPQQFLIKMIYHDVMYFNIDASHYSASIPAHHSVKHLIQKILLLLFWIHALGGNLLQVNLDIITNDLVKLDIIPRTNE